MNRFTLFASVSALFLYAPTGAFAHDQAPDADRDSPASPAQAQPAPPSPHAGGPAGKDTVSTGVAKGRDRLDSAVSTSMLDSDAIDRLSARNIGQILHSLPGIRAQDTYGDANTDVTVRGLPLTSSGSKYLQFEEDGLPVLEFGDMNTAAADMFLRYDANVRQIDSIRGGSASTFASNSPAGILNFISKTGETAGGSLEATTGVNYNEKRIDFEYGQPLDDKTRFHFGGFWHQGEGPRTTGFDDAVLGGQIKANITRDLANGYIRISGKLLDDRSPFYYGEMIHVGGTDASPQYTPLSGTDPRRDIPISPYAGSFVTVGTNGGLMTDALKLGQRGIAKSIGLETVLDVHGWTVSERFRYSANSGIVMNTGPWYGAPAAQFEAMVGATSMTFATGPDAGQVISNPAALGADGVLVMQGLDVLQLNSMDNATNDLRLSRVWKVGGGELTATAGYYLAHQAFDVTLTEIDYVTNATAHGTTVLIDLAGPSGPITQNGVYAYADPVGTGEGQRVMNVAYTVNAGFGSINFHKGKIAVGASVRYDFGSGRGTIYGDELAPNGAGFGSYPIVPGSTALAQTMVGLPAYSWSAPVNYTYHYTSYSTGINYRASQDFSIFARISQGGRANADRMLFTPLMNTVTGGLNPLYGAVNTVRQAEAGIKLRKRDFLVNLTAFWAKTRDYDAFYGPLTIRDYRAYGLEAEGEIHHGPFALAANATYTNAKVLDDLTVPANDGAVPLEQPYLIANLIPHVTTGPVSAGVYVAYVGKRYANISDQLVLPAYTLVNPYLQMNPTKALRISLQVYNVFNTLGMTQFTTINSPGNIADTFSGYGEGQTVQGRTGTLRVRLTF